MWSAASDAESHPILEWIALVTRDAARSTGHTNVEMSISDATLTGWRALRSQFRAWGIQNEADLSTWMSQHGYAHVQPGCHFHRQCQELIMSNAIQGDVEVARLEVGFVATVRFLFTNPSCIQVLYDIT